MLALIKTKEDHRPQFERSAETEALITAISNINGNEASYAALSSVVGFKVFGALPALQSAKRYLEREKDQIWSCRTGWGIFLADVSDTISIRGKDNASGRKKFARSRKRGRRMTDDQFNALAAKDQMRHILIQTEAEQKAIGVKRKLPEKTFAAVTAGTLDVKAAIAALIKKK